MNGTRTYTIGEVSDLLGVKPHVIRYWEQEMPLLAPRKGMTGRRVYRQREIRLLLRVKHLLHEQRYTVEGARRRIWEEIESDRPEIRVLVAAIRDELLDAWLRLRRSDTRPMSGREGPGSVGHPPPDGSVLDAEPSVPKL